MTQTISGNLSGPARLLILNESDMSIEHNTTTSGSYEVSGLSDGSKVVLARAADGETFGYASVSGVSVAGATYLMTVDSAAEFSSTFTDSSSYKASTYFSDAGFDSPATVLDIDSNNGTTGAGIITTDAYSTTEKITMEFDWIPLADTYWYHCGGSAQHYVQFFNPNDYSVNTGTWNQWQIESSDIIRVALQNRCNEIWFTTWSDSTLVGGTTKPIIWDATGRWRPVKIEIDWPNDHAKVWVDNVLYIDNDLPENFTSILGDSFKVNFHWHSYLKNASIAMRNLEMYTGTKAVTGTGTLLEQSTVQQYLEDFYRYSIAGGVDVDTSTSPGDVTTTLWGGSSGGVGGSSIISTRSFPTTGTSTITFDWRHGGSGDWYDDEMSNAENYILIAPANTWYMERTDWYYSAMWSTSSAAIAVHLRVPSSKVTYANISGDNAYTVLEEGSISYLSGTWRPVKIVIDWNAGDIEIWVDDSLVVDSTLSTDTINNMTDGFDLGVHWHSYNHGSADMQYKDIKIVQS